jgi:hypothetical protein
MMKVVEGWVLFLLWYERKVRCYLEDVHRGPRQIFREPIRLSFSLARAPCQPRVRGSNIRITVVQGNAWQG